MKNPSRFLVPALAGVAAFGISFALRRSIPAVAPGLPITSSTSAIKPITDPRKWTQALAEQDPAKRLESLADVLTKESASGLKTLAEQQLDHPDTLALILRQWAGTDPRSAAGWAIDQKRNGRVTTFLAIGPVIEVWAGSDPAALTAWLKESAPLSVQYSQVPKLIAVLFSRDAAAALALAGDFPRFWKLPEESMDWIKADPEAATKACFALPATQYSGFDAALKALEVWAEKDPQSALTWAKAQAAEDKTAGDSFVQKCLSAWAARDPAAAAAYFATLPRGERSAFEVVKAWAAKDLDSTMHWLEQTQVPNHAEMIAVAVGVVAESDLGKAASLISGMEDGGLRDKATASLTANWAAKDPEAALAWASQLAPGPARNKSISQALSKWARNDVTAAAEWSKSAPAGSVPPQAYTSIAQNFGKDLPAVASWMNELPDGPAMHALDAMFTFSRETDVTAALALPPGKYTTSIVEKASLKFFQMGPDQALAWALSLPDAAQRQQMRKMVEAIEPTEQYSYWNGMTKEKKAEILQRMK